MTQAQAASVRAVFADLKLWVLVASDDDKGAVLAGSANLAGLPPLTVYTSADVDAALRQLSGA